MDAQRNYTAWCLRFDQEDLYEEFKELVTKCIWETGNGIAWEKAKKEDTGYALETYRDQDVEMVDVSESEQDEEDAVEDVLEEDEEDEEESSGKTRIFSPGTMLTPLHADAGEEDEEAEKFHAKTEGSEVNTGLAVGYKSGRTFVIRGGRIGVFKHEDRDENSVLHDGTINTVTTLKGKSFAPKRVSRILGVL